MGKRVFAIVTSDRGDECPNLVIRFLIGEMRDPLRAVGIDERHRFFLPFFGVDIYADRFVPDMDVFPWPWCVTNDVERPNGSIG